MNNTYSSNAAQRLATALHALAGVRPQEARQSGPCSLCTRTIQRGDACRRHRNVRVHDFCFEACKKEFMKEPKCRICGCKQNEACPGGCGWVDPKEDAHHALGPLCSVCQEFLRTLGGYVDACHTVSIASLKRLLQEVTP